MLLRPVTRPLLRPVLRSPMERGGNYALNPTYYVDSVNGNDANDGLSAATAKQTIAAIPALATGNVVGLARGSYWREQFKPSVLVHTVAYGTGNPPALDGADVIDPSAFSLSAHADAAGVVYEVSLTRDPDGVYVSGDTYMLWEDGAWLTRKTTVADVAANPGTFYVPQPNALAAASLAYVHPLGSTNPTLDGRTYEYSKRAAGIELAAIHGAIVEGIHCTRGMSAYGPLPAGRNTRMRKVLIGKGGKHNTVTASGTLEDVICFDAETGRSVLADGGLIPFTFYQQDPSGLNWDLVRCMSVAPVGRRFAEAVYAHGSTGTPGHHNAGTISGFISLRGGVVGGVVLQQRLDDICSLENTSRGMLLSSKATSINVRRAVVYNVPVAGVTDITHPGAGATLGANIEVSHCAHYKRADGAVTTGAQVSFDPASVVNYHHNTVAMSSGGYSLSMQAAQAGSQIKFNIFVINKTGTVPYMIINHTNIDSDYNVFIDAAGATDYWQSTTTGTAFSIAEWRTETGCDINSVVINLAQADTLFLNGVAGLANGDFRLNPACALTYVDGTPLVGNAGPQEYYDWNTRSVQAGQPQAWPTPPQTEAECKTYISDPAAWDFYP